MNYNAIRDGFGTPLIEASMKAEDCSDTWSRFIRSDVPTDTIPFHASKTILKTENGKVLKEKDIYRKVINDTTLLELSVLSNYDWSSKTASLGGTIGSADKRYIYLKIGNIVQEQLKYPDFKVQELKEYQIDSVLNLWKMQR